MGCELNYIILQSLRCTTDELLNNLGVWLYWLDIRDECQKGAGRSSGLPV